MIGSTTMCEKRVLALLDMYGRDTVLGEHRGDDAAH